MMFHSPLDNPVPFAMTMALMLVMAFQFGWFREQFCTSFVRTRSFNPY